MIKSIIFQLGLSLTAYALIGSSANAESDGLLSTPSPESTAADGPELVLECLEITQLPWPLKVTIGFTEQLPAPSTPYPNFKLKYVRTSEKSMDGLDERTYENLTVFMPPPGFINLGGARNPAPEYPALSESFSLSVPRDRDLTNLVFRRDYSLKGKMLEFKWFGLRCKESLVR